MARNLQETIESIKAKVRVLIDRQEILLHEKAEAENRIELLTELVEQQKKEIERLRVQVEYLNMVSVIATNPDSERRFRDILSELVQDIDQCIADLTE